MSSAKAVVEAWAYSVLAEAISGATVYQDVPNDAPLPLVVIGDLSSRRLPGKDRSDDRIVTLNVLTLVEAEERAPVLALQEQIDTAIDGANVELDGWTLAGEFAEDEAVLQEDGASYVGVSTFTILALAE